MSDILIEVTNLQKSYYIEKREISVLKGIDTIFKTSEITAIVGPSGAGKTTFLNLVGALDRPTSGEIRFRNKLYTEMRESEFASFRNKSIGFVFQFHNLLGEFTALENVMLPMMIDRKTFDEAEGKSREVLIELGLKDRMEHKPSELSGGEQQRVAVARALVNSPEIVLADEPSGNLDHKNGEMLTDILWNLCRDKGYSFVIVTHNKDLAEKADRIINIHDGKVFL